ncbi:MAG: TIGR03086 family metal-binding protein [Sciscionella sp.]
MTEIMGEAAMTEWPDLLARTYDVVRIPMAQLDDTLLDRPTPCAVWTLRQLVGHTIGAIDMFTTAAGGSPPVPVATSDDGSLVERFDAAVARNVAAWRALADPAATLTLPFAELPADLVAGMNQLDSLVHGWDIGSSLGLRVDWPDELSDVAMRTAQIRVPPGRGRVFGAEVSTASTSPGERLLAFTGRDPAAWPGAIWVAGSLVTVKPSDASPATASAVEIWEREGSGPPRHIHAEQDELWYVLEGRFTFAVGDREFQADPGEFILGPQGVAHTFRADTARSRLLDIHLPGGFERFFVRAGRPATTLVPPPAEPGNAAAVRAAIEEFGASVVGPPLSN